MSRWILLGLTTVIAACGFKLRGDYNFPPEFETIYIESRDSAKLLVENLIQSLNTKKTSVTLEQGSATTVLRILSSEFNQRTLSFDSRGRPREFELTYVVQFDVLINGKEYVPRQTIRLLRDYEFDGINIGAGENQRVVIREDLQSQMAQSILRRISSQT